MVTSASIAVLTSVLSIALPFGALAQEDVAKKRYATSRTATSPVIDGRFDDTCWAPSRWADGFVQRAPFPGAAPSQATAFNIVYDEKNLYIAIRAYDSEPGRIESRVTRRDDRQGDQVEIFLDSYFDHQTAFVFNVNSAGVRTDYVLSEDRDHPDDSWDAVWQAAVDIDEEGWTAEIAIPLTQLRFAETGELGVWGVQVRRILHRKEETSEWQRIPNDASGFVHLFGELHGLSGISAGRQIELLPYTVAKAERFEREAGNPFATGARQDIGVGLDGRVAVTSDLMLTFTANPDFGQVEADPSQVNLGTFELFFEERRPFFVEGKNILDFSFMGNNLFYSRRIGRPPQGSPDVEDDAFHRQPANTSILGAFKLTGKTKSGWSIGLLDSVTSAEYADIDLQGARRREGVEPFTNYFVGRVQKDFDKGQTKVGAMLTTTHREGAFADAGELHRAAYTLGLDLRHNFFDRNYFLELKGTASQVRGDAETILRTQKASTRYFQRPDADYVDVDETLTALSGHGGSVRLGKDGGGHLRFSANLSWLSPGLDLNDVGFMRFADQVVQWTSVGWNIWEPFSIFRSLNLSARQWRGWDFGGTRTIGGRAFDTKLQFRNYWRVESGTFFELDTFSNNILRGGPSLKLPGGVGNWFDIHSDNRRALRVNFGAFNFWGEERRRRRVWVGGTYRPANAVAISAEPFVMLFERQLQYVDTAELDSLEERYVMGSLDQTTLGIVMRVNYSITPNLSVQYYGQPFLSSGAYDTFKRITAPRAELFEERFDAYGAAELRYDAAENTYHVDESSSGASYSFENPNFDLTEFRSNLVIRWEYRPGSTLFVVWSQDRSANGELGSFAFREGLDDLFRQHPTNVFLVKFNYRFSL